MKNTYVIKFYDPQGIEREVTIKACDEYLALGYLAKSHKVAEITCVLKLGSNPAKLIAYRQ